MNQDGLLVLLRSHILMGLLSIGVALSVLVGWSCHVDKLITVCTGCPPMQVNTAIGFLLVGLGFLIPALRLYISGAIIFLGTLVMIQYALRANLGLDTLVVQPWEEVSTLTPGRMSPFTAMSFILFGALAWLNNQRRSLALLGLVTASPGLWAYLLQIEKTGVASGQALHTSILFLLMFSYALFRSRP